MQIKLGFKLEASRHKHFLSTFRLKKTNSKCYEFV